MRPMITGMATLAAYPPPLTFEPPARRSGLDDRVSVPDSRVGSVIGFYSRVPEMVLVLFGLGHSREFAPADLHRLA